MVKQATTKTTQKEVLLTVNTLKVENKKLTNKNILKWVFFKLALGQSHWPSDGYIGPRQSSG